MLQVVRLGCSIVFADAGRVSSRWATTVRGGFGTVLRELACSLRRASCEGCLLRATCAYAYLFETPVDPTAGIMRKYPQAPRPFVLEMPEGSPDHARTGSQAAMGIVLIGKGIGYLPWFILALDALGGRGLGRDSVPFRLAAVTSESGRIVYEQGQSSRVEPPPPVRLPLTPGPPQRRVFKLDFLTPTRLQVGGKRATRLDLPDIVASAERKAFLLGRFHCDQPAISLDPAFREAARDCRVLSTRLRWVDHDRFSTRQRRKVPLGGLVGEMVCEGDLGVLRPLLRVAEYVHLGKNTTFGLGRVQLVEESPP